MPVILQFNCLTHNETARKAMENYIEILQKAFEHYQNLWEDYIKLQEKYEQCNVHSLSQVMINTSCIKTKDETTSQHLNDDLINMQENNSIPLLELDTLNMSSMHFNSDTRAPSDASESLHKDIDGISPPKSPVFSRTFLKANNSVKKFVRSPKAVCNSSSSDMKTHHGIEKGSSKYNHKLELSTTHHVETTFLPDGKKLKQSRLAFYPIKSNEKMVLSSSVDKHKPISILHNVEQNSIDDVSVVNTTVTTENCATNNSEIFEDVIEISPTQRNIASKVKRHLRLERKLPVKHMINISSSKNKCHNPNPNAVPKMIDNIDFGLCPLPKYISTQMTDDKFLMNTVVTTLKDKSDMSYLSPKMHNRADIKIEKSIQARKKDQSLTNKAQNVQNINNFAYEDETFYLPAEQEQATNKNDVDNFNLDTHFDTENKPPKKKILLDKFNILPKRKADISEQINMQCKAKLNGWDCWECKEYYKNLPLSKEELQKRKNQCSRHRHKYERPNTPEGFWNPEFPETLSCTYQRNKN